MEYLPLVVGVVVLVAAGRHVARRRVAAGQGAWVWVIFAPMILGGLVSLWAAGTMLAAAPVIGIATAVVVCLYLASVVLMLGRASRGISAATSPEELESALTVPMTDHAVRLMGAMLLGGLIAVVALIIYGVTRTAH